MALAAPIQVDFPSYCYKTTFATFFACSTVRTTDRIHPLFFERRNDSFCLTTPGPARWRTVRRTAEMTCFYADSPTDI